LLTFDTDCRGLTPIEFVFRGFTSYEKEPHQNTERLDVMRLLLRGSNSPPGVESYSGSSEGFSLLQQSTDPLYYQQPLAKRVDVAFKVVKNRNHSAPALLQIALGESITSAQAVSLVDTRGRTILHIVAYMLAQRTVLSIAYNRQFEEGRDPIMTLEEELLTSWQIGEST